MSDPKDNHSFLRKVVKFVANPATDWSKLDSAKPAAARDAESARSELKALIERKRRNDFVRKREFDMLRKIRREGLSSEQAAAIDLTSNLDDGEARQVENAARPGGGMKAKIDAIEQQMANDAAQQRAAARPRAPESQDAPTLVMPLSPAPAPVPTPTEVRRDPVAVQPTLPMEPGGPPFAAADDGMMQPAPAVGGGRGAGTEANDVVPDPELDEAVIAFANGDFDQCEQLLLALVSPGGARAQHPPTWLVLFDLYRATGRQQKFENLALDYAQQFGWSAPQWYSLPKLVADAAAAEAAPRPRVDGQVGWAAPAVLDTEAVTRLAAQTLHMPLPWVFDWSALTHIDPEACRRLDELMHAWMAQPLDMRWLAGEKLLDVLQQATPPGGRGVDPVFWQLRLDVLRMTHRPHQFDEAAIDYCVTYEVSPPSWEPVRCKVRIGSTGSELDHLTEPPPVSRPGEGAPSSFFAESMFADESGRSAPAADEVTLSGQLVGDIGPTLDELTARLGAARAVRVSCTCLVRVDFLAAGDLLNWALARRSEGRSLVFADTHRLVGLFFCAMGIDEHAGVKVRQV